MRDLGKREKSLRKEQKGTLGKIIESLAFRLVVVVFSSLV